MLARNDWLFCRVDSCLKIAERHETLNSNISSCVGCSSSLCVYIYTVHVYASNEKVINKNRVIRLPQKGQKQVYDLQCNVLTHCSTSLVHFAAQLHKWIRDAITLCVGGHKLVSALFVAVLLTMVLLISFHYLFGLLFTLN